jgi:hypothetical protein
MYGVQISAADMCTHRDVVVVACADHWRSRDLHTSTTLQREEAPKYAVSNGIEDDAANPDFSRSHTRSNESVHQKKNSTDVHIKSSR